jgi:Peptidase A4 family
MHNWNTRACPPRSRRNRRTSLRALIALAAGGPILVLAYFAIAAVPGPSSGHGPGDGPASATGHTIAAADVQSASPAASRTAVAWHRAGGWGRGGYPMMTGSGADGSGTSAIPGPENASAAVPQVASANWAGYAAAGPAGSYTSVSSSWTEPAVTCAATDAFSSFWVGLDGDGTPTVEQTGTEADCQGGTASYQGWYEVFPSPPVFFANPVQAGDAMSASVTSDGDGTFTLVLSDGTQGWTQSTRQAEPGAQLGSAEIIAEAPSSGTVLPLADFGTVNFAAAMINHAPLGVSAGLGELIMTGDGGTALAAPSAVSGGDAFAITPQAGAAAAGGSVGGGGGARNSGGRRHHHHVLGTSRF